MASDLTRVQAVFLAAAELTDPAARALFLAEACGGDLALKSRVEALLRAHDQPDSLLDEPLVAPRDSDNAATQAIVPTPDAEAPRTSAVGDDTSDEEPLTFLSRSSRPDALGRLGHYDMLQVLGKGGFGIVFRAFDETLQRVVAVKVMAPQIATLSPARKRFLREARSSAQVRHENVVQIYEVGEQPLPYLAMEFIPGETLQQKLDRCGPLDVPEVLRIGRQIAEGLAAAHACDLIHRDIKPGNVLLEGGVNKAKITDFGLARTADDASISQSGVIAGTPLFMSPEQALGHKVDQRADLFSLGSVLYTMASGRPPFRAPSTLAVLKRVAEESPRPIPEIIPETPQWLCSIITKLHAKNPDNRFQSAREVADLLADCEAKLKAKQEVKNVLPDLVKSTATTGSGGRKWAAVAAVLLLPVIALAVTEFVGVTHLFWGPQVTPDVSKPVGDLKQVPIGKEESPPFAIAPFDAAQAKIHQEAWATYLGVPVEYPNSIGIKMRLIPPGKFLMGSPDDEEGREGWEGPQHAVVLTEPFYIGVHDVTVGQFKAFVKAKGYQTEAEKSGGALHGSPKGGFRKDLQANWQNPGFEQTDENPVVAVSWHDAQAFCEWLSDKEGKQYTLPTEARWEYSCRAGAVTRFYSGDADHEVAEYAWYSANSEGKTHPVGQKKSNAWGLYDITGNVWQWTGDWYNASYYRLGPKEDPPGPSTGRSRVLRGCSIHDDVYHSRAACRHWWASTPSARFTHVGFRVVQVGDLKAKVPPVAVKPFTDADVQRIAALPAAEQVEEVRKELMRRNPDFDGMVRHTAVEGVVTEFRIVTGNVTDVAPIRAFNALRVLDCGATAGLKPSNQLADLTALRGMNVAGLTQLHLCNTRVSDAGLAPFQGCKNLVCLSLHATQVSDAGLAYFKDCKALRHLNLAGTQVSDAGLAHLRGMSLTVLAIEHTGVTDLGPLQGMPLAEVRLTPKNITRGLDVLRDMKGLKTIGIAPNQSWPAAEFWERHDKGEFRR
jgi:formylglycine-generating enzyme required for sulfatase activity